MELSIDLSGEFFNGWSNSMESSLDELFFSHDQDSISRHVFRCLPLFDKQIVDPNFDVQWVVAVARFVYNSHLAASHDSYYLKWWKSKYRISKIRFLNGMILWNFYGFTKYSRFFLSIFFLSINCIRATCFLSLWRIHWRPMS